MKPATLLLADNNATLARVVTLSFEREDIRVVSVTDGREAVKLIDLDPPDVVLAEIGTAHVDGYGVATHVKSSPSLRHIPVLLLSGAFEPIDDAKARATGCDGILVKPFDPRNLVQRVKALLAARDEAANSGAVANEETIVAMSVPVVELPPDTPTELPPVLDLAEMEFETEGGAASGPAPTQTTENPVVDLQFDALDAALADLDGSAAKAPAPVSGAPTELPDAELPDLETLMSFEEPLVTAPVAPEPVSFASLGAESELELELEPVAAAGVAAELPELPEYESSTSTLLMASPVAINPPVDLTPAAEPPHPPPVSEPAPAPVRLSLSGAFATFLSEEAGPSAYQAPIVVPPPARSSNHSDRAASLPSGQTLEEIVRRVLTEMTGDAVRAIVRDTAERLVREEIERLKAHPE